MTKIKHLGGKLRLAPALWGACVCLLLTGVWRLTRPHIDPKAMYMAHNLGVEPGKYQDVWDVMEKGPAGKRIDADTFARILLYTRDPNPNVRMAAYDALRSCRSSTWSQQARSAVDAMRTDASPEIRRRYAWTLFILRDERWRQEAERLASSADAADQGAAKTVTEAGQGR